jgi:poly(A) polymerase
MREIWLMQPRFEKRVGSTPFGLVEQPRFRAAFDFMRLRADVGEVDDLLADWWQEFSMEPDSIRQDMVDQVRAEQQQRTRATKVHRVASAAPTMPASESTPPADGLDAPRKRRRRRRSGTGNGGADGAPSTSQDQ